jgi:nitric oxide reductase NorD protein
MSLARINEQLAVLLQDGVADWEREELAEKLAALDPELRRQALRQLPVIWPVSYALYHAFVEQLARAATCLLPSQIAPWVNATLDCYEADGLRAAQLFLEEVESNFLCQIRGEAGVRLTEIEHRLLPYARGILGREVHLAPAETASFDTDTLSLPAEINLCHHQTQNFLLYKFTATFLMALDRLGSFRAVEEDGPEPSQPLAPFIGGFADPQLATDLFYLAEAMRILAHFQHDFPGLMRDFAELCPALLAQTVADREQGGQGLFVAALRRWLLHHFGALPTMDDIPLSAAVHDRLLAHCTPESGTGATLTLTRFLYQQATDLAGPYLPGPGLPFMGEIKIGAALAAMDLRRGEREEKLIKALNRMLNEQKPQPQGDDEEGEEGDEERPGAGRQPLSDDEGTMLLGQANRELDAATLEEQLAQGVLRIGGMEFELTEELRNLLREMASEDGSIPAQAMVSALGRAGGGLSREVTALEDEDPDQAVPGPLLYDEWDYRRAGFRKHWCQVQVKAITPVAGTFVATTLAKYRGLLISLRRQFEMMSVQETFVRRQRDGDEIDLDAVIEALSDLRAGLSPSDRLFIRLQRNDRRIATLFLLDMSSSTEGWVSTALKESLILMSEALSALGDRYAIHGFSGMRRLRSEIFTVKEFDEPYDNTIKGRIAAITPKEYTRMGPAIRHATNLLAATEARVRLLITLSDGKPEDYDGYKGAYAIEDTRHALIEAKTRGIHPFCITVDKEAHAYMAHMYGEVNYICIDQVAKLPRRMPEIYRNLTT